MPDTIQIDKKWIEEFKSSATELKKATLDYEATLEMKLPSNIRCKIEDIILLQESLNSAIHE